MGKNIVDMFKIKKGDIVNVSNWKNGKIDTIVNAAKPTLMGSSQGVDGAIHRAIDKKLKGTGRFNQKICEELGTDTGDTIVRCKRGNAVTTRGYGFCNHVIHVVGAKYDGKLKSDGTHSMWHECTSSCVQTLESCYYGIVEEMKKYPKMETVGIPIIGAGEYKVPFEIAAEIAVASVGNALVEWRNQDQEMFEMAGIKKIIFFVYDSDEATRENNYQCIRRILKKFAPVFRENKKVVYHTSWQSSLRYLQEVLKNDNKRGYFAIAKYVRVLLLLVRFAFFPLLYLKDKFAKIDWEKRRKIVEWITLGKLAFPLWFWFLLNHTALQGSTGCVKGIFVVVIWYLMLDTVTYLLLLIVMADIQKPSANLIRSLILLFINYVEVACDLAFLYHCYYEKEIYFRQALAFGFLGESALKAASSLIDYAFIGLNAGIKFFFVTLVFGYFMGHMRQRKFRS